MPKLVIFTGAGISADSGLSTFRGNDGLWADERIERICSFRSWKQNRTAVHEFYGRRRQELATAKPNAAHEMVARLQAAYETVLITQNIDDLHDRAAVHLPGAQILHVHGRLTHMMCTARACEPWDVGYAAWQESQDRCPHCDSRKGVKPDVVLFGENAPHYKRMWKILQQLSHQDVLLVIGTSGKVIDIGSIAKISPATTILSNLETSDDISMPGSPCVEDGQFDFVLHGRAIDTAEPLEDLIHGLFQSGRKFSAQIRASA